MKQSAVPNQSTPPASIVETLLSTSILEAIPDIPR
jgi:hypothetical protein